MFIIGDRVKRVRGDFKGMEAIVEGCNELHVLLTPAPDFEEMGELIGSTRGYNWHNTWVLYDWELVETCPAPSAYVDLFL